ncbi:unnamed protein product, partial [Meganyctiphanes norvegica]
MKDFLPKGYVKKRSIEEKIWAEHKKNGGKGELDAKEEYVTLARALKTYGVTFFLVKEKMKGKSKLESSLLGVTKDSVLRLDKKTKEILQTWPLTTVKRWKKSDNTLTLDFGDYATQNLKVQTTEGEPFIELLQGYIDIMLKKQRALDHNGIEGDDMATLEEDHVSPNKVPIMQYYGDTSHRQQSQMKSIAKPVVNHPGVRDAQLINRNSMQQPTLIQTSRMSTAALTQPQIALMSTLESGQTNITNCIDDLEAIMAELQGFGTDPESDKWKQVALDSNKLMVTSQITEMNAATSELVTLISSAHKEENPTAIGDSIQKITSNLPEMTKGVQLIAALSEGENDRVTLLSAAKNLCSAFSDILTANEPEKSDLYQNILDAASKVGEASKAMLCTVDEEPDHEGQDIQLGLAKTLKDKTADLIVKAKSVASNCKNQELQNMVLNSTTACDLVASQLVACIKVVTPTIDNPSCQSYLIETAKEFSQAVEGMVQVCKSATQDELLINDIS